MLPDEGLYMLFKDSGVFHVRVGGCMHGWVIILGDHLYARVWGSARARARLHVWV